MISSNQKLAIGYAVEKGLELQEKVPRIADEFCYGKTLAELAEDAEVKTIVRGVKDTRIRAVSYALKGNEEYSGLIDKEKYKLIWNEHLRAHAASLHEQMRANGTGIYNPNKEERKRFIEGIVKTQKKKGVGIHGQTVDERREASRLAVLASGRTPWEDEVLDYCYQRYNDPNLENLQQIADEINAKYYDGKDLRSADGVSRAIVRWRRHLKRKAEEARIQP